VSRVPPGWLAIPGPEWAYFFDVDGTLAELANAPGAARVELGLLQSISALASATGGALALVSGRTIADIDALFPDTRLPIAGQHGAERRSASGAIERQAFAAARMDGLRDRVAEAVRLHAGLYVEDKGSSIALHYRMAPQLGGYVHRVARALAAECGPGVIVQRGKRVVELLPAGCDKGQAVLAFLQEHPFRGRRPVFLGDDVMDEAAFATINTLDGCSVKVGPGRTSARWRLQRVTDVHAWLDGRAAAKPVRRIPTATPP